MHISSWREIGERLGISLADMLILALGTAIAFTSIPVSVGAILLMLGACIEMVTAGRVSFGLGNGRLWRRVRRGRIEP